MQGVRITIPDDLDYADLRAAREAAGHTQGQAAELLGVARRTWEDWEAGRRQPQPMVLRLYRLLTDQDPEYRLTRRRSPHP